MVAILNILRKLRPRSDDQADNDTLFITGPIEKKSYIYRMGPLKHIRDRRHFSLTLSPDSITLKSELTDTIWNTSKDGGCAVLINGEAVGAISYMDEPLKKLMRKGYTVKLDAMRSGWYAKGKIPKVITFWPPHEEFREWLKAHDAYYDDWKA